MNDTQQTPPAPQPENQPPTLNTDKTLFIAAGGLIVIATIAASVLWWQGKGGLGPTTNTDSIPVSVDNKYTELEPITSWVKASEDRYPVSIWYPSGWTFIGGGDKSFESNAIVYAPDFQDASSVQIIITDYALIDSAKSSIDSLVQVSPVEKIELLRGILSENAQEIARQKIENLDANAYVYRSSGEGMQHPFYPGLDRGIQPPREIYLVNTGNDVLAVTFENYEAIGEKLIDEFLSRLELNK